MIRNHYTRFAAATVSLTFLMAPSYAVAMTIADFSSLFSRTYLYKQAPYLASFGAPRLFDDFFAEAAEIQESTVFEKRTQAIDRYFGERSMPLKGYGALMVEVAEKYDIDWRLLPAIAVRESSGGKYACDHNPFGWASCKIDFRNIEEAIDVVGWNLGGHNPRTSHYYEGGHEEKLISYNGTIIHSYPREVLNIMDRIGALIDD